MAKPPVEGERYQFELSKTHSSGRSYRKYALEGLKILNVDPLLLAEVWFGDPMATTQQTIRLMIIKKI